MSEQTDTTTTDTTGTTDTQATQTPQEKRPVKSFYHLGDRKIFQVPSVPTAAQMKGDHIQICFGDLYVSRTMGWSELSKQDWIKLKVQYEQAKATGAIVPSYSGSGEPYVRLTITADMTDNGANGESGTVTLGEIVLMTFEVNPAVSLTPPPPSIPDDDTEDEDDSGDADEDEDDDTDDSDDDDDDL